MPLRTRVETGIYRREIADGSERYEVSFLEHGKQRWRTFDTLRAARRARMQHRETQSQVSKSEALAVRESSNLDELPELGRFVLAIQELIESGQSGALDEVRHRTEAASLYAKRKQNAEAERHYAKMRLIAEAALGVISFEDPEAVKRSARPVYRALAAAYERGALMQLAEHDTSSTVVAYAARRGGWTWVPGSFVQDERESVRWAEARTRMAELGLTLRAAPLDKRKAAEIADAARRSGEGTKRAWAAKARLDRMQNARRNADIAKQRGPRVDVAYSLLRKTLQAIHEAQTDLGARELDGLLATLYEAEDEFGRLLRRT